MAYIIGFNPTHLSWTTMSGNNICVTISCLLELVVVRHKVLIENVAWFVGTSLGCHHWCAARWRKQPQQTLLHSSPRHPRLLSSPPGGVSLCYAGYCERTDMADTLRRLTNTSSFSVLQDKLESWHKDYHVSYQITHDRDQNLTN